MIEHGMNALPDVARMADRKATIGGIEGLIPECRPHSPLMQSQRPRMTSPVSVMSFSGS